MSLYCQLSRLKARLGITDLTDDALLTDLIVACSATFDRYCNRMFERLEGATEEFRGDETEIAVARYPIEMVVGFDLKSDETRSWKPQSGYDFVIRNNCVISLAAALGCSHDQARVIYSGGYVLPGTTPEDYQFAMPSDLEEACLIQSQFGYENRHRGGLSSVSGDGGSIGFEGKSVVTPLSLLLQVQNTLEQYRRLKL
jgi:hypothetical protein